MNGDISVAAAVPTSTTPGSAGAGNEPVTFADDDGNPAPASTTGTSQGSGACGIHNTRGRRFLAATAALLTGAALAQC